MPSENELRNLQSAALQLSSIDPVCSVELRLMADCLARAGVDKIVGASAAGCAVDREQDRTDFSARRPDAARQLVWIKP
jgi:hypothetical protein